MKRELFVSIKVNIHVPIHPATLNVKSRCEGATSLTGEHLFRLVHIGFGSTYAEGLRLSTLLGEGNAIYLAVGTCSIGCFVKVCGIGFFSLGGDHYNRVI